MFRRVYAFDRFYRLDYWNYKISTSSIFVEAKTRLVRPLSVNNSLVTKGLHCDSFEKIRFKKRCCLNNSVIIETLNWKVKNSILRKGRIKFPRNSIAVT